MWNNFRRFENRVNRIVRDLIENLLPRTEDSITQFKDDIKGKLDALVESIDFKQKYNVLNAPAEPIGLMEMCTRKSALEEEQTLLAKVSHIREYPQLLDNDLMKDLARANIKHVS